MLLLLGCGGDAKPPADPTTVVATTPPLTQPEPPVHAARQTNDAGVAQATPATAPTLPAATAPLPPPKPTTIALAKAEGDNVDQELVLGDKAFEAGDNAAALKHYEAAKKLGPKRAAPIVGLARMRIAKVNAAMDFAAAKGNAEVAAAARDLKRAVQIDPQLGAAQVELGRALLLLGDAAGAIDELQKGAALLPLEAEAHSALGVALLAVGKSDDALASMARAAELDPGSAPRHGNLGTVLFMRGRVPDAVKEYEIQARLADSDPRAHSDLGTALLAANDVPRAVRELKRALALEPGRATFHSNLGYALQIQAQLPAAIAEYREALRLDPKLGSAWINLATALARDPKTRKDARAALEKARALDPADPRVKANLEELDALEKGSPTGGSGMSP